MPLSQVIRPTQDTVIHPSVRHLFAINPILKPGDFGNAHLPPVCLPNFLPAEGRREASTEIWRWRWRPTASYCLRLRDSPLMPVVFLRFRFDHVVQAANCSNGGHLLGWVKTFAISGRQSHHGRIFLPSYNGWQSERESFKDTRSKFVTGALPVEVSAAATALAVGGALFALTKLNKDAETETDRPAKTECEACGGSGLCAACNGEGFLNKNLSPDAAAKARATAKDAATRYTAGLAKKWNYCTTCGGGRGCQLCEGRGWMA